MKSFRMILPALFFIAIIFTLGCKQETTVPCEGVGQICFTNKLDSIAVINVLQLNLQFAILKDEMQCLTVTGDQAYNFRITCNDYYKDTTLVISTCEDATYIIKRTISGK
jgi:hypothetical protein